MPLKYKVWCPGRGETADDARIVEAFAADIAATRWARERDLKGENTIANGESEVVHVQYVDNDYLPGGHLHDQDPLYVVHVFCVYGAFVPQYYTKELKP